MQRKGQLKKYRQLKNRSNYCKTRTRGPRPWRDCPPLRVKVRPPPLSSRVGPKSIQAVPSRTRSSHGGDHMSARAAASSCRYRARRGQAAAELQTYNPVKNFKPRRLVSRGVRSFFLIAGTCQVDKHAALREVRQLAAVERRGDKAGFGDLAQQGTPHLSRLDSAQSPQNLSSCSLYFRERGWAPPPPISIITRETHGIKQTPY